VPAVGLDLTPGPRLASGRDADVFALDDGRVLRRYRAEGRDADGRPKTSEPEAEVMRHVRAYAYPVPVVHAARGPDMVLERVDGPTMLADLGRRPWMLWRHARLLARLHHRLHTIPAPDWLPTFTAHPPIAADDDAWPAPAVLSPMQATSADGKDVLLHLDLHPGNVILSARGPIVVDWQYARRGDGAADVASTWLILASFQFSASGPRGLAMMAARRLFLDAFLRNAGHAAARRQIPSVARFHLADPYLLPSERPAIYDLARRTAAFR
jgi:aminoglycoside phosphotransferase (APT) family kinase protein